MAIGTAAAILGGSIISGVMGSNASSNASSAQQASDAAATAEQRRQYDLTRADYAPYRQVGTGALNQLAALYGIPAYAAPVSSGGNGGGVYGGLMGASGRNGVRLNYRATAAPPSTPMSVNAPPAPGTPNYSSFFSSPDYNFARTEGQRGLEQSAAARGGAFSGNALRALADYNQGLASQQYGNYYNRLAGLAGIGQNATNSTAQFGANAANQISANSIAAGDARASGIMGSANSWSNALNSGLNAYGAYKKWW